LTVKEKHRSGLTKYDETTKVSLCAVTHPTMAIIDIDKQDNSTTKMDRPIKRLVLKLQQQHGPSSISFFFVIIILSSFKNSFLEKEKNQNLIV
jgi:hypothetical protein